jgi:hypothetical protein
MDTFYERLIVRAATIDELLSDDFEVLPGQKGDADLAAWRLAAWCRSCSSGDWSLFNLRLERDGLSIGQVLAKFATVRRRTSTATPAWIDDAIWIDTALQSSIEDVNATPCLAEPCAFEHLFTPVIERAEALLWAGIDGRPFNNLNESARVCLRQLLLEQLCSLSAPAIYDRFVKAIKSGAKPVNLKEPKCDDNTSQYNAFVSEMRISGFRCLFEEKPILLRLIATITRQWIDTSREFVMRLDADLAIIYRDILPSGTYGKIANIKGQLSDPHNNGRSVLIISLEDGGRVVYKPKDLRLDVA